MANGLGWSGAYGAAGIGAYVRQLAMDRIAQQQRDRQALVEDRNYGLQQDAHAMERERMGTEEKRYAAQQAATQQLRDQNLANQVSDELTPQASISPMTAGILRMGGRAGLVQENAPNAAAAFLDQGGQPDYNAGQQPGTVYTGTAQQNFQRSQAEAAGERQRQMDARQARTDSRLDAQAANTERHDRAMEKAAAGNHDLQDQLRQIQVDTAKEKLNTTREQQQKQEESAKVSTQTALDAVNRLLDPKDVGANMSAATGKYEMRGYIPGYAQGVEDFNGVRDQLVAALTLPNLGALKGPMSDRDVIFVKQLATRLGNTKLSEEETRKALAEAQTFLKNKLSGQGGPQAPAGAPAGGRRYNPATGQIE